VRLRRADLRRRVNRSFHRLRFSSRALTSHASLELVGRHWRGLRLLERIRVRVQGSWPGTDYEPARILLLLLCLVIVGGRRIRQLRYLENDPLVRDLTGLRRVPTDRTVSRWLSQLNRHQVSDLQRLNEELVAESLDALRLSRLTLDIDGTVVSTGLQVQWAQRGFNPHHRKVPSYYPITAYEAHSGLLVRVKNRPGNVHDGKASLSFLRELDAQVRSTLQRHPLVEYRMDAAFFRQDVLEELERQGAEYAIKVPFHPWLHLKDRVVGNRRWSRVDRTVSCFEASVPVAAWDRILPVVIYRKRVRHPTRKNFQLDLFDPADGHYEYSAITTNKRLNGRNLWFFLCGRGSHEQALGELRNGFAFDCVPSSRYAANSTWQILSVLAFNLARRFQMDTLLRPRRRNRKRTCLFAYETIQTLRYTFLGRAALLVKPNGVPTLDLGNNPAVEERFRNVEKALLAA